MIVPWLLMVERFSGHWIFSYLVEFRIWFKTTASNEVMSVVSRNAWRAPAFKFIEGLGICSAESWGQLWNCVDEVIWQKKTSNMFYQRPIELIRAVLDLLGSYGDYTAQNPSSLGVRSSLPITVLDFYRWWPYFPAVSKGYPPNAASCMHQNQ